MSINSLGLSIMLFFAFGPMHWQFPLWLWAFQICLMVIPPFLKEPS